MADVRSGDREEALFGISFSDVFRAEEYLVVLQGLASHGHLSLRDAVVVMKDENDAVRVRETTDMQPAGAAVTGALWTGAELVHTTLRPGASEELAAALVP